MHNFKYSLLGFQILLKWVLSLSKLANHLTLLPLPYFENDKLMTIFQVKCTNTITIFLHGCKRKQQNLARNMIWEIFQRLYTKSQKK